MSLKISFGHWHDSIIDGDPAEEHRDRRVRPELLHARSTVRGPAGTRSHPWKEPLPGNFYLKQKKCVKCGCKKSISHFLNYSVADDLRDHDGFNLACRDCQPNKYSHGYKLDDFIVDG